MQKNNDDEHKMARGIQRQKAARNWFALIGTVGVILGVIVFVFSNSLKLGGLVFVISLVLGYVAQNKILNNWFKQVAWWWNNHTSRIWSKEKAVAELVIPIWGGMFLEQKWHDNSYNRCGILKFGDWI